VDAGRFHEQIARELRRAQHAQDRSRAVQDAARAAAQLSQRLVLRVAERRARATSAVGAGARWAVRRRRRLGRPVECPWCDPGTFDQP
jgi:hypothetical protein